MLNRLFRSFSNPYKILGIPENSSKEQIKLAYYKLAKKYHPDINSNYSDYFKTVNAAYKELERSGFKYQVKEKNDVVNPKEEFIRKYKSKGKNTFEKGKTNWILAEVLIMV